MTRADLSRVLLAAGFGVAFGSGWSFQYGTEFSPGPLRARVATALNCLSLLIAFIAVCTRSEPSAEMDAPDKAGLLRVERPGHPAGCWASRRLGWCVDIALPAVPYPVRAAIVVAGRIGASVATVVFVYVVLFACLRRFRAAR
jgi:hypothetical protein